MSKYNKVEVTLAEYMSRPESGYDTNLSVYKIDTQPVSQRLPVFVKGNEKAEGIILHLLNGYDLGMITLDTLTASVDVQVSEDPLPSESLKFEKIEDDMMRVTGSVLALKGFLISHYYNDEVEAMECHPEIFDMYEYESIDGGHRKRYIRDYLTNGFGIPYYGRRNVYFKDLKPEHQKYLLSYKLSFTIYRDLLPEEKGKLFRDINMTTDVNRMEMLNSYGMIPVACLVRETSREVDGNSHHNLFEYTMGTRDGQPYANFRYLQFNNDRLFIDEKVAKILYRYYIRHFDKSNLLGGTLNTVLPNMYEDERFDESVAKKLQKELNEHLDFIRSMADQAKKVVGRQLSQRDFNMFSYFYFYLKDTYKFKIENYYDLFVLIDQAHQVLQDPNGPYTETFDDFGVPDSKGRSLPYLYPAYLTGGDASVDKPKGAILRLVEEIGLDNLERVLTVKDNKRTFTEQEKRSQLAEQNYKCYIDDEELTLPEAHAGHIKAYDDGGKTVSTNLKMVRAIHNLSMGTRDLEEYRSEYRKEHGLD